MPHAQQATQKERAYMPNATQNATNPVPCSPSPICVVVPRIAGTPIAPRDNIVFFLARLDGVAVPTVVAYALSYWISLELQVDISAKPMLRDFARYENGAWHLVDDFYLLESGMALSCLDGMRYANLIQDSAWHGGMDDPCEFEWIRDPSTFPSTVDRNIVPQEITAFLERCYDSAQRLGTQLFPYINCSMARFQQAAMHSRDTEVAPVTVPSSVASMTRGYGFMSRLPWHWVEYGENVSVLIDDQGQEVMEFDSDQMLVRNLPSGVPMRAFSDREALARRVASQRGLAVDGKLDTLMTERALGFNF